MDSLLKLIYTLGKNILDEIPIRQLSIESDIPYTTALRLIDKNKGLFAIKRKGNIRLISLNIEDSITKNYLIIAERKESENIMKLQPQLKLLKDDIKEGDYALLLFGSRAESKHRNKSDIDLCIINKDGKRNIRFSTSEMLLKLEINPMFFSADEFKAMIEEKGHNVGKEIIRKHIILHGEEFFWNLLFKD